MRINTFLMFNKLKIIHNLIKDKIEELEKTQFNY